MPKKFTMDVQVDYVRFNDLDGTIWQYVRRGGNIFEEQYGIQTIPPTVQLVIRIEGEIPKIYEVTELTDITEQVLSLEHPELPLRVIRYADRH